MQTRVRPYNPGGMVLNLPVISRWPGHSVVVVRLENRHQGVVGNPL